MQSDYLMAHLFFLRLELISKKMKKVKNKEFYFLHGILKIFLLHLTNRPSNINEMRVQMLKQNAIML